MSGREPGSPSTDRCPCFKAPKESTREDTFNRPVHIARRMLEEKRRLRKEWLKRKFASFECDEVPRQSEKGKADQALQVG